MKVNITFIFQEFYTWIFFLPLSLLFLFWLTWAIICYLFQNQQSRKSLYLHRNWNYQEYCVSTSTGNLNILETCIFFFFLPHLNKLNHSNAWPGTASVYIYIYIYISFATCFSWTFLSAQWKYRINLSFYFQTYSQAN